MASLKSGAVILDRPVDEMNDSLGTFGNIRIMGDDHKSVSLFPEILKYD